MSHVDEGTLHAYLDGELSADDAQSVSAHVTACPACHQRLEEERALIARASELLGLAEPPARDLPPFRPGDTRPPARLWWQVRLPLAWAATVLLALGIGMYVSSGRGARALAPTTADRAPVFAAGDSVAASLRQQWTPERPSARKLAARPAAKSNAESVSPSRGVAPAQVEQTDLARAQPPAPPPAPAPAPDLAPFSLDSARAVLGQDPIALPGAPIIAVRGERAIGYAAVVVVEQRLDSNTVVTLVERRPAPLHMDEVVVTGAAEPRRDADSLAATREMKRRAAPAAARPPAPTPKFEAQPAVMAGRLVVERTIDGLTIEIRGPLSLSPDSLQALLLRVRPVRP
jgi:anti-sigma factor RsiW